MEINFTLYYIDIYEIGHPEKGMDEYD